MKKVAKNLEKKNAKISIIFPTVSGNLTQKRPRYSPGLDSMRAGGEEGHIIGEPNGGNTYATHVESKTKRLGGDQLLCVDSLELITRIHSTLFHSSPIMDWPHQVGGEREEDASGGQSVGKVQQAGISLVASSSICTSNDKLFQNSQMQLACPEAGTTEQCLGRVLHKQLTL